MTKSVSVVKTGLVRGEASWAFIKEPRKASFSEKYQKEMPSHYSITVTIGKDFLLDKATYDIQQKIKTREDGSQTFDFRRYAEISPGFPNLPPKVLDANNQPLTKLVGNGSEVEVVYSIQRRATKNGHVHRVVLEIVRVLNLVEYKPEITEGKATEILDDLNKIAEEAFSSLSSIEKTSTIKEDPTSKVY